MKNQTVLTITLVVSGIFYVSHTVPLQALDAIERPYTHEEKDPEYPIPEMKIGPEITKKRAQAQSAYDLGAAATINELMGLHTGEYIDSYGNITPASLGVIKQDRILVAEIPRILQSFTGNLYYSFGFNVWNPLTPPNIVEATKTQYRIFNNKIIGRTEWSTGDANTIEYGIYNLEDSIPKLQIKAEPIHALPVRTPSNTSIDEAQIIENMRRLYDNRDLIID